MVLIFILIVCLGGLAFFLWLDWQLQEPLN